MGASGNTYIKTPNLDRFASEGISFDNMFSQYPLCGPSRACFVTGQYPTTHGARYNGPGVHPYSPKLASILNENGYRTGMVGIVDLEPRDGKYHGYDEYIYKNQYNKWAIERGVADPNSWQRNMGDYKKAGKHCYGSLDYPSEYHFSSWVIERTIELIDEWKNDEQPFFIWVGDRMPHPPYLVPKPYDIMYKPEDIPLHPAIDPENGEIDNIKEAIAHYYGLISLVDYNFGCLLDYLETSGLKEDTIVIYCSDHGNMIGHHGLFGKQPLYDDDAKIPFIIRCPRFENFCGSIKDLTEQIDVLPTLLDIVGIGIPDAVQGKSLIPMIKEGKPLHDAVFAIERNEWTEKKEMVRTKYWKLIYSVGGNLLFDLQNDPYEQNNLSGNPKYQGIENILKERLLRWHLETVDRTLPNLFEKEEGHKWIEKWLDPLV